MLPPLATVLRMTSTAPDETWYKTYMICGTTVADNINFRSSYTNLISQPCVLISI